MRLTKEKLNKHKYHLLSLGLILFLGLTPLLWFHSGYLIEGVDIDFQFHPLMNFIARMHTWSSVFIGGADRAIETTGLFFTGLQVFLKILGFSAIPREKILFIFWYTLTGLSMYYLMSLLVQGKNKKACIIRLTAVIFYMFNFYQFHIWMIVRLGESSGAILIPPLLGLFIKGLERKISFAKIAGMVAIFSLVGSGIGVQPPVLGVFLLVLLAYYLFHLLTIRKVKDRLDAGYTIRFPVLFLVIFLFINMFWILPVGNYTIQSGYTSFTKTASTFNLIGLLKATSHPNSFLNVIRLYGDNVWFDGYGGEPYIPVFPTYLTNPSLILLSFMLPFLAYAALFFSRHRYVIFFTLITLVATFIGKGIHPPLGNIFLWMFRHLPGFWIYRAPWQKFGIIMAIGYSFLGGITCGKIYEYLQKHLSLNKNSVKPTELIKKNTPVLIISLIIALTLIYNYAFILGKMFPTTEERKTLPGYHQKIPSYIFDAANWINSKKGEFNTLLLPYERSNAYDWGYGGAADITLSLFNKGLVFKQYGEGMMPHSPLERMHQIAITSLYRTLTPDVTKIFSLLGIRYILLRNDFSYDMYGDIVSSSFLKSRLNLQKGIHLARRFEKWDFYEVEYTTPHIYATRNLTYIDGNAESLIPLVSSDYFDSSSVFLFSDLLPKIKIDKFLLNISKFSMLSKKITIPVDNGWKNPVKWSELSVNKPYQTRSYLGWKQVISTDATGGPDMLVFSTPEECPYRFTQKISPNHEAYNSTLVYIKTGPKPLKIDQIYADETLVTDLVGIWWETDWMGMGTKPILFPCVIPPHQKAIMQINHLVSEVITLDTSALTIDRLPSLSRDLPKGTPSKLKMNFQKINPTKYFIHVNASAPFFLVFSESYHSQWRAYEGKVNWLEAFWKKPMSDKHFIANGYANSWYMDKAGEYDITLYYWPQSLFYLGLIISGTTFVGCVAYLGYSGLRKKKGKHRVESTP